MREISDTPLRACVLSELPVSGAHAERLATNDGVLAGPTIDIARRRLSDSAA